MSGEPPLMCIYAYLAGLFHSEKSYFNLPSVNIPVSSRLCDGQIDWDRFCIHQSADFTPVHITVSCRKPFSGSLEQVLKSCWHLSHSVTFGEEQVSVLWGFYLLFEWVMCCIPALQAGLSRCFRFITLTFNFVFVVFYIVLKEWTGFLLLPSGFCPPPPHISLWKGNTALYKSWCLLDC